MNIKANGVLTGKTFAARWAMAIAVGLVALSVSESATAGKAGSSSSSSSSSSSRPVTVNRDHRGTDGPTSVKPLWWGNNPNGKPRRDPGWANYGNGKGGPLVRDHRH